MPDCNWEQKFDRWFALTFYVESSAAIIVLSGLDEQMAHNRFNALMPDKKLRLSQEVSREVAQQLGEFGGGYIGKPQ